MNPLVFESIKNMAAEDPVTFGGATKTPILEWLYLHYIEHYSMQNEETKRISAALSNALRSLPFKERDHIFTMSSQLAAAHEMIAFIEGVKLGAKIMMEINEE